MPIYEYVCWICDTSLTDSKAKIDQPPPVCPECTAEGDVYMVRKVSAPGFRLDHTVRGDGSSYS